MFEIALEQKNWMKTYILVGGIVTIFSTSKLILDKKRVFKIDEYLTHA